MARMGARRMPAVLIYERAISDADRLIANRPSALARPVRGGADRTDV
jgi:hypothetical protein